jgi:DNA-binding winged helix-turn-helix (wHTH) protein
MGNGFSKQNQRLANAAYRFGDFELYPNDRLLKRAGSAIQLQPKSFDALLCLVRRAQHLVSKEELIATLWPSISVSEANLTNIIVSLRRVLGRDAIHTVSKYGYRFQTPVALEPGIPPATYKNFVRAKELAAQRSVDTMHIARDLLWTSVAEEPSFAAAWAWLGRCCWFLNKFCGSAAASKELTQAVFQRAFALDPDLGSAHEFYTFFQVDTGNASDAMARLLERLEYRPIEPESYVSLVQVLRFRGLLDESIEAHRRAAELDPTILSSVAHTMFFCGRYRSAIESYAGRSAYYLDAASWAALGNRKYAIALLKERLETLSLSQLIHTLLSSLLAVLEKRTDEAIQLMQGANTTHEPEIMVYFARHYAALGLPELAEKALRQAAASGFVCAPATLQNDSWLKSLRAHANFLSLLRSMEVLVAEARSGIKEYPVYQKSRGKIRDRTKR